jgi:predicted phage-related endonuclease
MGLSKYRSANDELQMSIDAIQGKEPDPISNEAMDWGNKMEPTILMEAANRLGLTQLNIDHEEAYFHDEWPISCSLDGTATGSMEEITTDPERGIYVVGQDSIRLEGTGVLEAKLTSMDPEDSPPLWRGPLQLQAQMAIYKASWGCIATLYKGIELRLFLFALHKPTLETIEKVSKDFQDRLDRFKNTGQIDHYPAQNLKDAARTYQTADDEDPVVLDDYCETLVALYQANKAKMEKMTEENSQIQLQIMEIMKNRKYAVAGKYQISWPTRTYKPQPAKITPAKEGYTVRQSTLTIKESK